MRARFLFCALLVCTFGVATVWGQATAQINGTATDTSGAFIPGVEVTATQTATGISRLAVTNERGVLYSAEPANRPVSGRSGPSGIPYLCSDGNHFGSQRHPRGQCGSGSRSGIRDRGSSGRRHDGGDPGDRGW